jgi:hypothetical protein
MPSLPTRVLPPCAGTVRLDDGSSYQPQQLYTSYCPCFTYFQSHLNPMDVFASYKPLRNSISLLAREDALRVIWACCQYLQIDEFEIPPDIEVPPPFLNDSLPQRFTAEWELELLAKEIILNANATSTKGYTLRYAKTLAETVNGLKQLENNIYGAYGSPSSMLVELIRIAHREFVWQGNSPNAATIIRCYKIFNHPKISEICLDQLGLSVEDIYLAGMAFLGSLLSSPALNASYTSDIKQLPVEKIERFLAFTSKPLAELKAILKSEQRYDADFAYAYSSLRAFPLIRMTFNGDDACVCPLPTLLFWRMTGGLYYDLINDERFAHPFGELFQIYVGEILTNTLSNPEMHVLPEEEYGPKKARRRSVDWIIVDPKSAVFLECKAKRLSWGAKASLSDLTKLEEDLDRMADAVV